MKNTVIKIKDGLMNFRIVKYGLKKYEDNNSIIKYFIVGVIATLFDWAFFYLCNYIFMFYYQISLVIGFCIGTLVNYTLNRIFTFKSTTKKVASQMSVHFTIALGALGVSILLMFIFVDAIHLHKMLSRIVTTIIVFFLNFILHKNITFNKKYFK